MYLGGFLCEAGRPGDSTNDRYRLSRQRLELACKICARPTAWLDEVSNLLIPKSASLPQSWRSAIWLGVTQQSQGIVLKPYFNLNVDSARDRWLKAGRVLQMLGRPRGLEMLCDISSQVSQDSWPVGLTVDILPTGAPGRIKIYFRSDEVTLQWLRRWYDYLGYGRSAALIRRFLEQFPWLQKKRYPRAAFTVGLEFHPDSERISLKTDLAVTKWMASDSDICRGVLNMTAINGGSAERLNPYLAAVCAVPSNRAESHSFRLVGLGLEPDGSAHLNVYVQPCAKSSPEPKVRRFDLSIQKSLKEGIRFLMTARLDGRWTDFELSVGTSNVWVTAYTLARLACVPPEHLPEDARAAIEESLDWLASVQSSAGGWGYNLTVPDDADSTAWTILAFRRHGRCVPDEAERFLDDCREVGGWFATYPQNCSVRGLWSRASPDVTATALKALEYPWSSAMVTEFSALRTAEGFVPAYWWTSPLYTTERLLEAYPGWRTTSHFLSMSDRLDSYSTQNTFDSALHCSILALLDRPHAAQVATELCRQQQRSDGSWPPSALLRLPDRDEIAPWNEIDAGRLFRDERAIFTTATVVAALGTLSERAGTQIKRGWVWLRTQ